MFERVRAIYSIYSLHVFCVVRDGVLNGVDDCAYRERLVSDIGIWRQNGHDVTRAEAVAHFDGCNAVCKVLHDGGEYVFFGGLPFVKAHCVKIVSIKVCVGVGAVRNRFEQCVVFVGVFDFPVARYSSIAFLYAFATVAT